MQRRESDGDERAVTDEEQEGQPYPTDPGAAYSSEPEPADDTFSEPEHWLKRPRR